MYKMNYQRINPKNNYKKSSKIMIEIEKTLKSMLTRPRIRRKYYHNNKYIDPWIVVNKSHKVYRPDSYGIEKGSLD